MLWPDGHHDHHFPHLRCAAPLGAQDELVDTGPDRFFRPPYVGGRGWIGVRLDRVADWDELASLRRRRPHDRPQEACRDPRQPTVLVTRLQAVGIGTQALDKAKQSGFVRDRHHFTAVDHDRLADESALDALAR